MKSFSVCKRMTCHLIEALWKIAGFCMPRKNTRTDTRTWFIFLTMSIRFLIKRIWLRMTFSQTKSSIIMGLILHWEGLWPYVGLTLKPSTGFPLCGIGVGKTPSSINEHLKRGLRWTVNSFINSEIHVFYISSMITNGPFHKTCIDNTEEIRFSMD